MPGHAGDDDRPLADAVEEEDELTSVCVAAEVAPDMTTADAGGRDQQGAPSISKAPPGVPTMWPTAAHEREPADRTEPSWRRSRPE